MAIKTQSPSHAVWYQYQIVMAGATIGSLTNFSPSSSQDVERIRGIDSDYGTRVRELLAGPSDHKIRAEKVQLFASPLFKALGREVYSLEDMKDPFDIEEYEYHTNPGPAGMDGTQTKAGGKGIKRVYHDCILASYERTITTGTIYIAERCDIEVSYITAAPLGETA